MSTITRSGRSALSTVMKWCSGNRASSLPRKKRSTPHSRIVATQPTLEPLADAYNLGLEHIRSGHYFEAHEELEIAWRAAEAEERDFYQGLVHVAVAWYQARRGNRVGCERQLEKARRRLGPYAPTYRGLDLARLLAQLERVRPLDLPEPDLREHPVQEDAEPPVAVEEEQHPEQDERHA